MNIITPNIRIAIAIVIPAIFPAFFLEPPEESVSPSFEKEKQNF
jgi:hypothetical protein